MAALSGIDNGVRGKERRSSKLLTFKCQDNKNGQSNTLLETHFKEANGTTKDTLGG